MMVLDTHVFPALSIISENLNRNKKYTNVRVCCQEYNRANV
jgi:hypothetical protein